MAPATEAARGRAPNTLHTARTLGRRINARLIDLEADRLERLPGTVPEFGGLRAVTTRLPRHLLLPLNEWETRKDA